MSSHATTSPLPAEAECLCVNHRTFKICPPKSNKITWSLNYRETEENHGINCGLKPAIIGSRF